MDDATQYTPPLPVDDPHLQYLPFLTEAQILGNQLFYFLRFKGVKVKDPIYGKFEDLLHQTQL